MLSGSPPSLHERAFLRRLAYLGARYGPSWWVRSSPRWFGAAFARSLPEARQRVADNLRWVLGPRSQAVERREVKETFENYAACLAESLGAERAEAARARVETRGERYLVEALANGRGAVIVTAHAGPWDLAARLLASQRGVRVAVVMQAERDASARALHDEVRRRSGIHVLPVGEGPMDGLPVLRHLRSGGFAAFQIDRAAASGRNLEQTLFGRKFAIPEGPFRLAALAGAPVLPLFAFRRGYFDYGVDIGAPIEIERRPSAEALDAAARNTAQKLEEFVHSWPTQWFHFADR